MRMDPADLSQDQRPSAAAPRTLRMVLEDRKRPPSDDLVHAVLGLMRQVADLHARELVARIALDSVMELE